MSEQLNGIGFENEVVVVRLDGGIARDILAESRPAELRLAPSVRGADLAEAGAAILMIVGSSADVLTLILAKGEINRFATRFLAAVRGRATHRNELTLRLQTGETRLNVDLSAPNAEAIADALRVLAGLAAADAHDISET
ncbi:MAG: hypothetical protein ACRCYU_16065 [Nocardioides sp.]